MNIVSIIDADVETYPNDPNAILNIGASVVVLSMPTMLELRNLWTDFVEELRAELYALWTLPNDEVVQSYGLLGFNEKNVKDRGANLYGLIPKIWSGNKGLARVLANACLKAMVDASLLTPAECGSSRFRRPEGSAAFLNSLSTSDQLRFFDALLAPGCNLDDVIRFNQGSELNLNELEAELNRHQSAEDFLGELARRAQKNVQIPLGQSEDNLPRSYAPIWFANYLAKQGTWLLPLGYSKHIVSAFPAWARPLQLSLALPSRMRAFGTSLMRDYLARQQSKGNDALVLNTACALACVSNVWRQDRLCAGPLIGYKQHVLSEDGGSSSHRSWAVNRLWEAQENHFGASAGDHPDSHAFVSGKRLVSKGVRPFEWARKPNPRNTKQYARVYGEAPSTFPEWLVQWADELEAILPLFGVETIENKIGSLNIWLIYLAGLPNPPLSFEEVSRRDHVNSGGAPQAFCFRQFLTAHYSETKLATSAMATLRQAWALAANQHGFASSLSNPVDEDDSPFQYAGRGSRTVRRALDMRVAELIAHENMRDDMVFARGWVTKVRHCWRKVRDPQTCDLIEIFFPAAPVLIHIILHTGMRGSQARWLDSGEGDEEIIDFERLAYAPNESSSARPGRRQGFLRVCHTIADTRSQVLGMWVNSGKSGPHEVPWVHEDVIAPVRSLQELQVRFYPISKPVEIERELSFNSSLKKKKGDSFPLARDPDNRVGHPLTADRLRSYWKALLEHCQPIVDAELGYHYPLISPDGSPRFDVHSLRVTVITTLLENGVPVTVVQMLVGHKSPIMTWYYQDVTNYKVHSALQSLIERRKAFLKGSQPLTEDEEANLTLDVVTLRSEDDFIGTEMLRSHRATGSALDVFSHSICPGGSCETGGEALGGGRYKSVWRPRACSGCRFRVTGPAFLNGLVQRANTLIWEIKGSTRKEAELNQQIEAEEDAGRPVAHLRSSVFQEQDFRDQLYNEWCLEMRTIMRAQELLRKSACDSGGQSSLLSDYDVRDLGTRFREVHQFELAQRLVHDADLVQANLELPTDALMYRDQVLHRIAYSNGISEYFYSLDPSLAKRALGLFGETLVTHTQSIDQMQQLIEGSLLLREVPQLDEALAAVLNVETREPQPIGDIAA